MSIKHTEILQYKIIEMFMTLNRRYGMIMEEPELSIGDLTTYIHPQNYNNIFAIVTGKQIGRAHV